MIIGEWDHVAQIGGQLQTGVAVLLDLIVKYRKMKNRGVVAIFRKDRFDHYSNFARMGRDRWRQGAAVASFHRLDYQEKNPVCDNFEGVTLTIPRTGNMPISSTSL